MSVPDGFKVSEVGVIPQDWDVKKLGDIGKFKNGINKGKEDFGFGYPFVNLLDIFGNTKLSNISSLGLVNSSQQERHDYNLKKGDILFVRSSVKPEGVGLTSVIMQDLDNSVYSGFLIRFRDFDLLDLNYKQHCFSEQGFRKRLIDNSTVSANTNINQDALKKLYIPLPPLTEQKAIAQSLSDVDNLITAIDKLITKKRNIKQGTMQELLTGKKRLPGFSGEWEVKKFDDITKLITCGLAATPKYVREEIGKPFLSAQNVRNGKVIYDNYKYISHELFNQITKYSKPQKGDLLYTRVGAGIGEAGIIEDDFEFGIYVSLTLIRTNEKELHNYFLLHLLNSYTYKSLAKNGQFAGGGVQNLNVQIVKEFLIPLPPIPEQKAIAKILTEMDKEIEALEKKREKYKNIKQGMMQELLTGKTRIIDN